MSEACELQVNGGRYVIEAEPDMSLLDFLHSELGLTGTRFGCGMGLCGACFVIVDDAVVPACETPLWSVAGKSVTTIEGLGRDGRPHPLQAAIVDHQAGQCGYCLSGVIVSGAWLLDHDKDPDREAVVSALDRNLCRCGAQQRMVRAVLAAGGAMRGRDR
jgi:nicotinate dehydrogenase subunit A